MFRLESDKENIYLILPSITILKGIKESGTEQKKSGINIQSVKEKPKNFFPHNHRETKMQDLTSKTSKHFFKSVNDDDEDD